jgi:hypothetical protein
MKIINDAQPLDSTLVNIDSLKGVMKTYISGSLQIDTEKKNDVNNKIDEINVLQNDLSKIDGSIHALFFSRNFYSVKKVRKHFKYDNVIIYNIKMKHAPKQYKEETILHEMFHYVDLLLGTDGKPKSSQLEVFRYLDTMAVLDFGSNFSKLISVYKFTDLLFVLGDNIEISMHELLYLRDKTVEFRSLMHYYTTTDELYVRFQMMKIEMVKLGVINSINDKITTDNVYTFLNRLNIYKKVYEDIVNYEFIAVLIYINTKQIEELDKQFRL